MNECQLHRMKTTFVTLLLIAAVGVTVANVIITARMTQAIDRIAKLEAEVQRCAKEKK